MLRTFATTFIVTTALIIISCEKKYLEIVPVVKIEDISIKGAGNIYSFSFPSDSSGYAVADKNKIYRTRNGGKTWSLLPQVEAGQIKSLEFFNDDDGIVLIDNMVYKTKNGGESWSFSTMATFIGQTNQGVGVACDCDWRECELKLSVDAGESFEFKKYIKLSGSDYLETGKVIDDKVINFPNFNIQSSYQITDIYREETKKIHCSTNRFEDPNDIYYTPGPGAVVGRAGSIADREDSESSYSRNYENHSYTYYSVDGYNDLIVAVGEKSIVSNLDIQSEEKWNEVFDSNGNGFTQTFYKIKFKNSNTFYLSGENGIVWRVKL